MLTARSPRFCPSAVTKRLVSTSIYCHRVHFTSVIMLEASHGTGRLLHEHDITPRIARCAPTARSPRSCPSAIARISTFGHVNRGSTFALRRSTLEFCLGGQLRTLVSSKNILLGSREATGSDRLRVGWLLGGHMRREDTLESCTIKYTTVY